MKSLFFSFIFVLILSISSFAQNQGGSSQTTNIFNTAMQQVQKTMASSRIFNPKSSGEMLRKPASKPANTARAKTPAKNSKPANNATARNRTKPAQTNKPVSEPDEVETYESTDETETSSVAVETTYADSDSQILVEKIFAEANPNDPQTALLREVMVRGWNDYKETSIERGYQHNDLARALSYYIGTNYNVYQNSPAVSQAQSRALFNQVKQFLSSNKDIANMKDEDKQLFSELLVFMTSVPVFMNTLGASQNNAELVTQSRDLARQNLENLLGMKVEKLKFTSTGMETQQ